MNDLGVEPEPKLLGHLRLGQPQGLADAEHVLGTVAGHFTEGTGFGELADGGLCWASDPEPTRLHVVDLALVLEAQGAGHVGLRHLEDARGCVLARWVAWLDVTEVN